MAGAKPGTAEKSPGQVTPQVSQKALLPLSVSNPVTCHQGDAKPAPVPAVAPITPISSATKVPAGADLAKINAEAQKKREAEDKKRELEEKKRQDAERKKVFLQ